MVTAPERLAEVELATAGQLESANTTQLPLEWTAQPRRPWPLIYLATDAAMLAAAFLCADVWARAAGLAMSRGWAIVLLFLMLVALNRKRLHRSPLHLRVIDTVAATLVAAGVAISATVTLRALLTGADGS